MFPGFHNILFPFFYRFTVPIKYSSHTQFPPVFLFSCFPQCRGKLKGLKKALQNGKKISLLDIFYYLYLLLYKGIDEGIKLIRI